ncbi:MAG: TIGR04348 family glycosyltransferase [Acidobacteria bacterium]|nr:MAG: TIGR04348 family glycosyltransferase [Acidobacteriota bacterium]
MKICLITPAPPGSRKGNRVTAERWARILRSLGHRVIVDQAYRGQPCQLLVALHARRSFASIRRFRRTFPRAPMIVALTGTDLYNDIHASRRAHQSLQWATRLIVLQPMALDVLPPSLREKARVIYQSAVPPNGRYRPGDDEFRVCVLAHLRPVKDPFRAAMAARRLPSSSRIRIVHLGAALSQRMEQRARREMVVNPRYRWLGDRPHWHALRILAGSHLLVLSSKMEGGANVISEAIAASVPILSSRIPGSIGLLGPEYPGTFPVGDTGALAALLHRAETDPAFYRTLKEWGERLKPLVEPARECQSWKALLDELFSDEGAPS